MITSHDTSKGPLFLYLPFQETHGPAEVPLHWREKVDSSIVVPNPVRRDLLAKLMALDSAFENITNALKNHENGNMLTNTVWIYTADNGGPIVPSTGTNDDALGASNWPLRGGKHNAYEGGVRGAAFLYDGRGLERGGLHAIGGVAKKLTYDGIIHAVDWLPTLCALAGCVVPAPLPAAQRKRFGLDIDGIDHSAALRNNDSSAARKYIVLDIEKPKIGEYESYGVVRIGEYKLHLGPGSPQRPGDWSSHAPYINVTLSEKTTHFGKANQLYNVVSDPAERDDVINSTNASIIAELVRYYEQEKAVAVYPFSLGEPGHPNEDGIWEPWL